MKTVIAATLCLCHLRLLSSDLQLGLEHRINVSCSLWARAGNITVATAVSFLDTDCLKRWTTRGGLQ